MKRLTERFSNGQAAVQGCGSNCEYDYKYCNNHLEDCPTINEIYEKLATYEDLEDQGKLLKNPEELKNSIATRMKEFMDEYRRYSESSIDHFGGKADAMETAIRIVNAAFSDAMQERKEK